MEDQQPTPKTAKSRLPLVIASLIIAVLVIGGVVFALSSSDEEATAPASGNTETASTDAEDDSCTDETGKTEVTLTYDANENFVPQCVRVDSGTTIVYKNDSDFALDVGADPHPTHTGNREVSHEEFELPVEPNGGTATTVMEKTGTFGLHNHENSSATATIIVE